MNDYEDAFDLEIKNKVMNKLIFIKSDLCNVNQNCYYHENTAHCSFKIGEALRYHLPFCVYSEAEYLELYKKGRFKNIDNILSHIKTNRLPDRIGPRNGIYSETLLDMLVMIEYPGIKKACIRTLHRQKSDNNELKGFDSIHMLMSKDEVFLILGQAKLGDRDYCIRGIKEDIKKVSFLYTYDELAFIADKRGSLDPEIRTLLSELNDLFIDNQKKEISVKQKQISEFFYDNNVKIIIPCLLAYEKSELYGQNFESNYTKEITSIMNSVKGLRGTINLDTDLFFMFFPIFSKNELREGMNIDE